MRRDDVGEVDASTGHQLLGSRARHDKFDFIAWPRVRGFALQQAAKQFSLDRLHRPPNERLVYQAAGLTPSKARERDAITAGREPNEALYHSTGRASKSPT